MNEKPSNRKQSVCGQPLSWASAEGTKREIETENQDFLENMKLATQFQSAGLIFAMPVYLPV